MDAVIKQKIGDEKVHLNKLRIVKNLLCISTSFLFLFMAYDGLALLQASMNNENGVGVLSQAVVYVGFAVGALVLPKYVIKKHGCKTTMLVGMVLYIPYIASNYYPTFYTLLPTAALLGIGAALLWGSQCTYFNEGCLLYWEITTSKYKSSFVSNINVDADSTFETIDTITGHSKEEKENKGNKTQCAINQNQNVLNKNLHDVNISRNLTSTNIGLNNQLISETGELLLNSQFGKLSYGSLSDLKPQDNGVSTRLESINAIFFGLHGFLYLSANVWSNIMSYFILRRGQTHGNATIHHKCLCGSLFCNDVSCSASETIAKTPEVLRNILTIISVILSILSILIVYFYVDSLNDKDPRTKFSLEILFATLKRVKYKEQVFLIPLSIFGGLQQGFYIGDYTRSFIACSLGTYNVGLVTITYGLACVIASSLGGVMVKLTGRVSVFVTGFVIFICNCVILLVWQPDPEKTFLFFLCSTLFGIITGCFLFQVVAFYGVLFKDNQEAAFSFHYLCISIGFVISFGYNDYLCSYVKIYILMVVASIAIIGFLLCERSFYLKKIQTNKISQKVSK